MATSYEEAIAQLFQASQERFVPERKRLSLELKAAGDKAGAARFGRLNRPPVSAWVVNQLWWNAQEAFEQLFATAARQRAGDRAAASEHRQQLAELRARSAELLQAAGHAASESTLRRVTMTLAALAVAGNFEPDAPGALTGDRDPPGFETLALESPSSEAQESEPKGAGVKRAPRVEVREPPDEKPKPSAREASREEAQRKEAQSKEAQRKEVQREEATRRKEAEEQERRVEAQRARRQAERERLHAALQSAQAELDSCERAAAARREELATTEKALGRALASAEQAAARLKAFDAEG